MIHLLRARLSQLQPMILCLSFVFFLSGAAGLIYQVVWQRALTLYYGVGPVSVTVIVTIFMLGLGVGSLIGGQIAEKAKQKVLIYFGIEVLLAIFGFLSLSIIQWVGKFMAHQNAISGFLLICLFLAIPTCLMGMTLPLVVKIFNSQKSNFLKSLSFLYFINTVGAALGALIGSYFLVSLFGLSGAVQIAAAINLGLALVILLLAKAQPHAADSESTELADPGLAKKIGREAFALVFVTGFLAIGYQIIWFRIVNVLIKSSPYAFASVLFVYLLGIGFGSLLMNRLINKESYAKLKDQFFQINFFIAAYVLISVLVIHHLGGFGFLDWMIETSFKGHLHPIHSPNIIFNAKDSATYWKNIYLSFDAFIWPFLILFVPTLLMGASFPLVAQLSLYQPQKEGQSVARVYWWNIIGNVLGGFVTGFILLRYLGTEWTLILFIHVGLIWLFFSSNIWRFKINKLVRAAICVCVSAVTLYAFPKNGDLYVKLHRNLTGTTYKVVFEEGVDGIVVSSYYGNSVGMYINGSAHGGHPSSAFAVEIHELVGYAKDLTDVLVIGFGAGYLTELLLAMPEVKSVTVVEISESVINNLKRIPAYDKTFADPRLKVIIEDGRRFLSRTKKDFDIVTMDPLRSTTAYSNNIYSKEFFDLVKARLKPDGVLMAWMNEYRMIPKTIAAVFENVRIYYYFVLATKGELLHQPKRQEFFKSMHTEAMIKSMESRFDRSYFLRGGREFIDQKAIGYPILTDFTPRAEYYFGLYLQRRWRWLPNKSKYRPVTPPKE